MRFEEGFQSKVSVIRNQLVSLDFLKNYNFIYNNDYTKKCKFFKKIQVFCFSNSDRSQTLKIFFSPKCDRGGDQFDFYLSKKSGEYLNINRYLVDRKLLEDNEPNFYLNFYDGLFEDQVKQFFDYFKIVCDRDLNGILTNQEWEEQPFDWKGYK